MTLNADNTYINTTNIIYDETNTHYMCPNEARLRDMTYGMTIHYDVEIEFIDILEEGETPKYITDEEINIQEVGNENDKEGGAKNPPKRNLY